MKSNHHISQPISCRKAAKGCQIRHQSVDDGALEGVLYALPAYIHHMMALCTCIHQADKRGNAYPLDSPSKAARSGIGLWMMVPCKVYFMPLRHMFVT